MKNLFGCVPGSIYGFPKTKLHYLGVARVIADVASVIAPDLTVIDGITAMEGTGPLDGTSRQVNSIIVGSDVAATDALVTRMMGFSVALVPQFWYALSKGVLSRPILVGQPLESLQQRFAAPDNIAWMTGTAHLNRDEQTRILDQLLASRSD